MLLFDLGRLPNRCKVRNNVKHDMYNVHCCANAFGPEYKENRENGENREKPVSVQWTA